MSGKNAQHREGLFARFVDQQGHEELTMGQFFWCPLCRRPFGKEGLDGDPPQLSLAHIIPKVLGGTWVTLACTECNNGYGREIENDLTALARTSDWIHGLGDLRVGYRMGDGRTINATSRRDLSGNHTSIVIKEPMKSPAVIQMEKEMTRAVAEGISGQEFTLMLPWTRRGRDRAAIWQSAYLMMFHYFGYDFVRLTTYDYIRDQITDRSSESKTHEIRVFTEGRAQEVLQGKQGAVVFLPDPIPHLMVLMRHLSPGGRSQYLGVVMSSPIGPRLPTDLGDCRRFATIEHNRSAPHNFALMWQHMMRLRESSSIADMSNS